MTTTTCLHCERVIVFDPVDGWVDPEADGDDVIWRESCDRHDTFTAEHEPKVWRTFPPPRAEDALTFDEVEAAGLDGTLRFVGAADQTCEPGRHLGPVVPTGDHEIIDDGVAFWFRCETCGQTGDGCIDVSEINLEGDRT